jgi:hypothetical protein
MSRGVVGISLSSSRNIDAASSVSRGEGAMTILALYKLLLYGGLALLVGSLVALEVFLNWKYPLPPRLRLLRRPDRSRAKRGAVEGPLLSVPHRFGSGAKRDPSAPLGMADDSRAVSFRR